MNSRVAEFFRDPAHGNPQQRAGADAGLVERSYNGIFAHFAGASLLAIATDLWISDFASTAGFTAIVVLSSLVRIGMVHAFPRIYPARPRLWYGVYASALFMTAAGWSWGLVVTAARAGPSSWEHSFVLLLMVAMSSGAMMTLCSHFRLQQTYFAITWIPTIVWYFLHGGREAYALGTSAAVMLVYVQRQGRYYYASYWSNVSSRKQLEAAREAAVGASRAKSEFLANISHEIRTPMNGVLGMLALALEENMAPRQRDMLTTARQSAEALLALLNQILDFSKIEAGKLRIENVPFALPPLVTGVVQLFQPEGARKGISVDCEVSPDTPAHVIGDPTRLRQILVNLIANAVKFTSAGAVSLKVTCQAAASGSCQITFVVTDTGIGISTAQTGQIFNAFEQADGATTRRFGGTGLGLTISRQLAELLGGSISVESELGIGSRFTVSLRFPIAEPPPEPSPQAPAATTSSVRSRPLRILVAEDNVINQKVTFTILHKAGHSVAIANNGIQAVEYASTQHFDVILMDVQMPEMGGLEATAKIRQLPAPASFTPIIGVTANAIDGDRERCIEAGMNSYLSKPFRADELARMLLEYAAPPVTEVRQ